MEQWKPEAPATGDLFTVDHAMQLARAIQACNQRWLEQILDTVDPDISLSHGSIAREKLMRGWHAEIAETCQAYMAGMSQIVNHAVKVAAEAVNCTTPPLMPIIPDAIKGQG